MELSRIDFYITDIREQMSDPEISLYEKSILGSGLWSGLDCEKKGIGPIMSNCFGRFFIFSCANFFKFLFDPEKVKKLASKVAHNRPRPFYFTVQPRPTAHSPELIFHIMKSRDQTSALLFVVRSLDSNFFSDKIITQTQIDIP